MLQSPRKQHEAKQIENDIHGGWLQSNRVLLLFLFLKDNNTLSREHTVNLLCPLTLLLQVCDHKSAIISWEVQGLGHVYKITSLMQTNLRVAPREPGRLLSHWDYCQAMACPHHCVILIVYSVVLKKNPSPKTQLTFFFFLSVRMFLRNAVIPRMWCLVW